MIWRARLGAVLLAGAGCGARTELAVATSSPSPCADVGCTVPTAHGPFPTCSAWTIAGPLATVSEPEDVTAESYFTSMVPSAGGALLTWFTLNDMPTVPWRTRGVSFDGTPRSDIRTHLSFPTMGGAYTGVMSLAASGCTFGGLVDDEMSGCRFLPLDQDGAEIRGVATVVPVGSGCSDLGVAGSGFSFLTETSNGGPPFQLVTVNADGSPSATTMLPAAMANYDGRHVLHDESFLSAASRRTTAA